MTGKMLGYYQNTKQGGKGGVRELRRAGNWMLARNVNGQGGALAAALLS